MICGVINDTTFELTNKREREREYHPVNFRNTRYMKNCTIRYKVIVPCIEENSV